jgi:hypothetical protein
MKIQEKIKNGEQAKSPQGADRLGASGDGAIDRRARRAAWAEEDAERARQGLPKEGLITFKARPEASDTGHHG